MKSQRPVNLELTKFSFPLAAIVSILHRISGIFLFAGTAVLLWLLDASLASEERFLALQETLTQPLWQIVIWAVLAALAYHVVAGVRHLLMDVGIGDSLKGGRRSALLTLVLAVILMILAGVWLW